MAFSKAEGMGEGQGLPEPCLPGLGWLESFNPGILELPGQWYDRPGRQSVWVELA